MNRRPPRDHSHSTLRPQISELLNIAAGRWIEILTTVGLPAELLDGRGHPCPRCGGRDRFAAWRDVAQRGAVHCRRCFTKGTNPRPGDGLATLQWFMDCDIPEACQWLAEWLGVSSVMRPTRRQITRVIRHESDSKPDDSLAIMAGSCLHSMRPAWWDRLSEQLQLPVAALQRLRVGWFITDQATTWPMVDHEGRVIGIRLRSMRTGEKWSVRGGRAGLFVPTGLSERPDRLFIAEGPTDTAALLSLGFDTIGRPSCNGALGITTKLVDRTRPTECVIVADNDGNDAGRRGAESLASVLVAYCPAVRIILPPENVNDARAWMAVGASADDVMTLVNATMIRSLTVGRRVARWASTT